ncbi:gluconate 2-dehydrogenase subunit 3 family protein [Achromobacter aloeverae]
MSEQLKKDRRIFLRNAVTSVPAIAILGPQCAAATPAAAAPAAASPSNGLKDYKPLFFQDAEWHFVNAACDRLIPRDETGPGALDTEVPIFIDRQLFGYFGHAASWYMEGPFEPDAAPDRGYQLSLTPQQLYRLGIAETDLWCQRQHQKTFSELTADQQTTVLSGLEKKVITSSNVPLATFFHFLLQNTKEGFFADPAHGGNKGMQSWTMIGYPGARASYLEWVDKYGEKYPLGPTSLNGSSI